MKKGVLIILGLALVIIVGVTIIFFLSSKPKEKPIFNYDTEGFGFLDNKEYSMATQSFKKAINQNTSDTKAYIELSNIYILKNDLSLAETLLTSIVDKVDSNLSIYYQLAKIYYLNKEYDKAETSLLKVAPDFQVSDNIKLGSNGEITAKDVVKLFVKTLNREDKGDVSKKLVETYLENSKSTDAYLNILASLLNYSAVDTANKYYASVVSFDEKDGVDSLKKTSIELKATLDKTVADTKGDFADTNKANIARMLISFEFNTPAINMLNDVIIRNLEFDLLYMLRGIAYFQRGDLDKAQLDLEKANSLNPYSEETLISLARLYGNQENVQKSIETFEQTLRLFPNNELNLYDYAKMLYKEQLYSQSVNQYLKLIAKNSVNQSKYKIELAKIYLDKIANYDEVLVLTNELIYKWSGYKDAGNSIKADIKTLETWAKYNKQLISKPEDTVTTTYLTSLNDSLSLDPTNIRTNLYIGELYIVSKDFVKARENLEKVIDYDLLNEFTPDAKQLIETKIK